MIRLRSAQHFVMGYIWVGLPLSAAKSLIFPRGVGQTKKTVLYLRPDISKDMRTRSQFEQLLATIAISGGGKCLDMLLSRGDLLHDFGMAASVAPPFFGEILSLAPSFHPLCIGERPVRASSAEYYRVRTLRLNRLAALFARVLVCSRFCLRTAGLMKPKSKLKEISACASTSMSSSSEQRHWWWDRIR